MLHTLVGFLSELRIIIDDVAASFLIGVIIYSETATRRLDFCTASTTASLAAPLSTYMRHGCVFPSEDALEALVKISRNSASSGTLSGMKSRQLYRCATTCVTDAIPGDLSKNNCINISFRKSAPISWTSAGPPPWRAERARGSAGGAARGSSADRRNSRGPKQAHAYISA
ncbi:unnamed protein product [Prorocentrum cordatum]|uniref:Uncharacterized protein n=1 Tax=Prorocentrum cordatum TaxID=2364126 RepID=A0ABN9PAG0_9DINO|nr:unnamed protein product [Polarella glacialis]